MSAGTLSPTDMVTRSPGTKLRAKKSDTWPSRILHKHKNTTNSSLLYLLSTCCDYNKLPEKGCFDNNELT